MSEEDYKQICPKSSRPSLFSGAAKLHKLKKNDTSETLPLRLIISNVGTATYKTAKYLASLLSLLALPQYSIKTVTSLLKVLRTQKTQMGKNLVTNVLLDKTIKIILTKIYQEKMLDTNIP